MADKQHTVTPQQKRTLAVMSEAQMRVAHAEGWGRTPNPRDLEVIAHCERLLSRPEPKAKKPSKISTGTVPAPESPTRTGRPSRRSRRNCWWTGRPSSGRRS